MPSRRSSARRPAAAQPEFLIDRSLGRLELVKTLRSVGLTVRTLADIYGEEAAQETEDTEWIRLAAEHGWIVLCKDERIRRRPAERDALIEGRVRVFCLTNANLSFADQAGYFMTNRFRIIQAARKPGPYLYGVYKDSIARLWPLDD
jgi:PIN like domain